MKKTILSVFLVYTFLCSLLSICCFAEEEEKATIRVGYYDLEEFLIGASPELPKSGFAYDLLCEIATVNGWKYELVHALFSVFAPDHSVDDADVALDNLDNLRTDVLLHIVGHGNAVVAILAELHSRIDCLEQALTVYAGNDETTLVNGFWPLGAGTDADSRERMTDGGKETALLGQCSAIADYGKCVHLKAVVVMEPKGFVLNDTTVKLESACSQTVPAPWMAGIQNWHIIFLSHLVDGVKERKKIFLRVDVFLTMGREIRHANPVFLPPKEPEPFGCKRIPA